MRKRFMLCLLVLGILAPTLQAELGFVALSVTATSQTYTLQTPKDVVSLCNLGTNEVYYRLFWDGETTAAATTASAMLVAGSVTAPVCVEIGRAQSQPAPWRSVSIVCAAAETALVHLQSE